MESNRRPRLAVIVAYAVILFGPGVWAPYFPRFLSDLGLSGWEIGLLIGCQPALRWVGALAWASVADRWRIRHPVMMVATAAGSLFFFPLLFLTGFWPLLLDLGLLGLMQGTIMPMLDATVLDHLDQLGGNYGRLRMWGSIGFIAAALVSAPLIHLGSAKVVPILLLIPALVLLVPIYGLPRGQAPMSTRFSAPWKLLTPPVRALITASLLLQVSSGAWGGFFALHVSRLGFSDAIPGITWALAVIVEVGLLYWGRQILERVSPARLITVSLLITTVRWAATAVATQESVVVLLQLGHAFSFAAFHLATMRLLPQLVPAERSTSGQAIYGAISWGIGASAGLIMAGALVDRIGTRGLFGVEALIVALALPAALRLERLVNQKH